MFSTHGNSNGNVFLLYRKKKIPIMAFKALQNLVPHYPSNFILYSNCTPS